MLISEREPKRAERLISQWLTGAYFTGFSFSCYFALNFNTGSQPVFEGKPLPKNISLTIYEDCWLGDEQAWTQKVKQIGEGVQPEEPLIAFELAKFRWNNEGAVISSVEITSGTLKIKFDNAFEINARATGEDEYFYMIRDADKPVGQAAISVTFDSMGAYICMPES